MDLLDLQLILGRRYTLDCVGLRSLWSSVSVPASKPSLEHLFKYSDDAKRAFSEIDATQIREDRRLIEAENIQLIDLWSAAYPPQLARTRRPPVLLYVRGDVNSLMSPQLGIVGSRRPSLYGRRTALSFAAQLAKGGLTITSGLADGIDAASHEGALSAGGQTIAVLGTGIDRIYPRVHRQLARRIAGLGALVSELPPRSPPLRHHFPLRNRIISGLSKGLLVVEAARDSGSLITAAMARLEERALFAIPGSIHNPTASGCHSLIRTGAWLTEDPVEILQQLKIEMPKQLLMDVGTTAHGPGSGVPALDKQYKILLDALGFEAASVDELVARTGLPSQSVASMLLSLELAGAVGGLADGHYLRLSSDDHATQRF